MNKSSLNRTLPLLAAALVGCAASFVIAPAMQLHAQPSGATEQYAVINLLQNDNELTRSQLEQALNQKAQSGWKVRASVGSNVILAK